MTYDMIMGHALSYFLLNYNEKIIRVTVTVNFTHYSITVF